MRFARGILALVAIIGLSAQLHATERHVPSQYPTIQAAVDACVDGDVVVLAPGVYTGDGNTDVSVPPLAIAIRSLLGDPNTCIIDGEGLRRGFVVEGDDVRVASIHGLAFANCAGTDGGTALTVETSYAEQPRCVVSSCVFTNNHETGNGDGGAIRAVGTVEINGCSFVGNSAGRGGAVSIYGSRAVIANSSFTLNSAISSGGAIIVTAELVIHCTFADNTVTTPSSDGGGALYGAARVLFCEFTGNSAWVGGALSGGHEVGGCAFVGNSADIYGGAVKGEGIRIANSLFARNTAGHYGGAICSIDAPGTGVTLSCVTAVENTAGDCGGAIYVYGGLWASPIDNSIIRDNVAPCGADVALDALTDPAAYRGEYPECVRGYADMNADGLVNNGDIDAFVALLGA